MTSRALFAGLCTLDLVQAVERPPSANEKVTALRQTVAAGGPAANAAVTFAHLGGAATLVSAVGRHPLAAGIRADLSERGVRLLDLTPDAADPPAVSTIMVSRGGDRAVVSVNAAGLDVRPPPDLDELVAASAVVHLDGHHPALALEAARLARRRERLVLLDGGSWKPGTAGLLPHVDVAVVSADFRPPGAGGPEDVLARLRAAGVPWTAVTRGAAPVLWRGAGPVRALPVPEVAVVDTLGAGDVLHGALTFALCRALGGSGRARDLDEEAFASALEFAVPVAAASCGSFGTRAWLRRRAR
ncbi:kinase [Sphaerisporangium krabiense]|uniref:Sugar/nucleoside kinase (Ribokinase family) n=1 Tax=Sphaerisporangium krabiense TaxID=763782 RepID=A0A7W8Z9E1_9ACTN|nr:PfkB family carbohydrate kinase [Sphaerisporangium krabiense]MBB5629924.1 sugar/nucleoside kinase (ribokinase family) [Sphaerisporangium krabiense]GII64025.1 kinase [Sphaerisporangium krabiense]